MLISAAFHYVRPSFEQPFPAIFGVTPAQFRAQLTELAKYAGFISQDALRRAVVGDFPLPERAWLVTLDDGLREQYEHAWPVLQELGIPAIFFVNPGPVRDGSVALVHKIHLLRSYVRPAVLEAALTEQAASIGLLLPDVSEVRAVAHYRYDEPSVAKLKYLLNFGFGESDRQVLVDALFAELIDRTEAEISRDLYMSPAQIAELAAHDAVGSHTFAHRSMGSLTEEDMARDISLSLELLGAWCGRPIDSLSYPYGSREACPPAVGRIAASGGVRFAFTMERAGYRSSDDPYFIPRAAANDLPGGRSPRWDGATIFGRMGSSAWRLA